MAETKQNAGKMQISKLAVFDSGIGGMSMVRQLQRQGITTPLFYVSDAKYMPYGALSKQQMQERVTKLVEFCFANGCDAVILACNSASSALPATKFANDPRVVGVIVPTIRHLRSLKARDVHVVATVSTIKLGLYEQGLPSIVASVCPSKELATIVERGAGPESKEAEDALAECLAPGKKRTQLLLACTHYEILPQKLLYQNMPALEKIWLPCECTLKEVSKEWSFLDGDGKIEAFCSAPTPGQETRVEVLFGVKTPAFRSML